MVEINNKTKSKISAKLLTEVTEKFLQVYKIKDQAVSIALVGDRTIRNLNKIYRGKDKTTDILSFSSEEDDDFLGEIIIDYAQIKRQAKQSVKYELVFILVHGLLHLIGYTDDTEAGRLEMIEIGQEFIKKYKKAL